MRIFHECLFSEMSSYFVVELGVIAASQLSERYFNAVTVLPSFPTPQPSPRPHPPSLRPFHGRVLLLLAIQEPSKQTNR